MPPIRKTTKPRPYGKQAQGRTIKSLSLDADLVDWAEGQASVSGKDFSAYVSEILEEYRTSQRGSKKS